VAQQFSHITWNLVESNLKTTRADVFLIFDCCHASDLGRESALTSRSFEYLAASTSTYTRSPGGESFTSALIWALEKLAHPSARAAPHASPMFTTSKLAKMICDCPAFPKDQKPSLTTRDIDAWQHIILAPLPRQGVPAPTPAPDEDEDEEEDEHSKPVPQFLSLTFHFKQKQDEADLKKLADHLKKFMKLDNAALQKVQWGGIWGGWRPPPGHRIRDAVRRLMARSTHPPHTQDAGLSPLAAQYPLYPSTERTPLLSDTSSVTLEEDLDEEPPAPAPSLWCRISSFFRDLRAPALAGPPVQPTGTASNSGRKPSEKWTRRLKDRLRNIFCRSSPWILASS